MLSLAGVAVSCGVLAYNTPCPHSSSPGNSKPLARLCNPKLARQITILVADFEGEERDNYHVAATIRTNLKLATEKYSDVRVKPLGKTITEEEGSEVARKEGKKHNAAIVLWGWYDRTETTVPLSVNFEVLAKPEDFPDLGEEARGKVRTVTRDELENFTIQTQLSNEMSYLTLVTLGLSRYAVKDWQEAIARLRDALEKMDVEVASLNSSAVRLYRGNAYAELKKYDRAFDDYARALELNPNFSKVYSARCLSFVELKEYDKALADCNRALEIDPNDAWAYHHRGHIHLDLKEYEKVIADYNRALEIELENGHFHAHRCDAYSHLKEYEKAIVECDRAIELNPDYDWIYSIRGEVYARQGNPQKAKANLQKALEMTNDPELRQKIEQQLQSLQ